MVARSKKKRSPTIKGAKKGSKKVSRRSSKASSGLDSIKCLREVHERLCSGWGVEATVRFIREEKQELTDRSHNAVRNMVREYKKAIPPGDLVAKKNLPQYEKAAIAVADGIDEIHELEELFRIQLERLNIDVAHEKKLNKLFASTTSEVKEARQLLETLAQLKMDLGIHHRMPQEHSVSVEGQVEATVVDEDKYSPKVKKVLDSPESRRRVQGLVDRFLQLGAGERKELGLVTKPDEEDAEDSEEASAP